MCQVILLNAPRAIKRVHFVCQTRNTVMAQNKDNNDNKTPKLKDEDNKSV